MEKQMLYDANFDGDKHKIHGSQKANAIAGFLYGLATLIFSALMLRNGKLQIQNYVGENAKYRKEFPTDLLGCCATTAAVSILQMTSCLMYFCEDLSYNTWKWAKFVLATVFFTCFIILSKKTFDVDYYDHYYYFLLGNSVYCTIILMWDVLCSSCYRP